jgi:hypothetical protein
LWLRDQPRLALESARARPKNGYEIPHFFEDGRVRFTNFGVALKKLPAHRIRSHAIAQEHQFWLDSDAMCSGDRIKFIVVKKKLLVSQFGVSAQ